MLTRSHGSLDLSLDGIGRHACLKLRIGGKAEGSDAQCYRGLLGEAVHGDLSEFGEVGEV